MCAPRCSVNFILKNNRTHNSHGVTFRNSLKTIDTISHVQFAYFPTTTRNNHFFIALSGNKIQLINKNVHNIHISTSKLYNLMKTQNALRSGDKDFRCSV